MPIKENKARMLRYYLEIWQNADPTAEDELVASDLVDHMALPGSEPGRAGHHQKVRMIHQAFPDLQFTIGDLTAEGDKVVGRWTMQGHHQGELLGIPPTGKSVTMTGIDLVRFGEGRVQEVWHIEDILGMLQQVGAIPRSAAAAT